MLATLTREPFSDEEWIFEPKLDGIRCLAFRKGRNINLYSRNRILLNTRYPELVRPLLKQRATEFIVDGEIVAIKKGISRFELLQKRMQAHVPVFYYLFDILYLEGHDLARLELRYRKELLRSAFSFQDPLRFSEHREKDGEAFFKQACIKGWEGIIGKRADAPYVHRRSPDWLKFKCENQQEFVIIGYTDPMGQRTGIGALLVGVYQKGKLLCAGKVGTGFDTRTLKDLEKKLSAIERSSPSCIGDSLPRTRVHWVAPKFVAQVGFTEWTSGGKLRHPRFLGLRMDKKPSEVVRE
jgi:DNA ligase D-like protein (predicted ligase)